LNEAVRLNPADEKAYGNRGNLWQLKGDQERTLADLDIQIRLHPKDSFGYPLRGDTGQRRSIADYNEAAPTRVTSRHRFRRYPIWA
jgi:hypothetical protein